MKNKLIILICLCIAFMAMASTNVLELTWQVPPGWRSTLYTATNASGGWSLLSTGAPPVSVNPTGTMVFFYVQVAPPPTGNPIMGFFNDPTAEGVIPANTNLPALCYSTNGSWQSAYFWNIDAQTWN
jgi:hypothetical protein